MPEDFKPTDIWTIGDGTRIPQLFEHALKQIVDNIDDPNTEASGTAASRFWRRRAAFGSGTDRRGFMIVSAAAAGLITRARWLTLKRPPALGRLKGVAPILGILREGLP